MIDRAPALSLRRFLTDEFFQDHFRGSSSDTRRTYETAIDWFAESLGRRADIADLTADNLAMFWNWASNKLARSTARGALQRLRTLWRAAFKGGHTLSEPPQPYWWKTGLPALPGTSAESKPPPGPLLSAPILRPGERPASPRQYLVIYCLERGLAPQSERQLKYKLTSFENYLGHPATWNDLNDITVNSWLAALCERRSQNSVRGYRAGLLALWRGANEARIIEVAPQRIRRIKRRAQRPTAWTMADLDKLLKTCALLQGRMMRASKIESKTFWTAYVLTGYYVGLRLADMLALRWEDISTDGILTAVQNKTGDLVACQLPPDLLEQLSKLHGDGRQRVFGDIIGRASVLEMFRRLLRAAGLPGSSKWLRRSGASHVEAMMPGGARGFLGHRSDISLAYAHYVDPSIAMKLKPLPPQIEQR